MRCSHQDEHKSVLFGQLRGQSLRVSQHLPYSKFGRSLDRHNGCCSAVGTELDLKMRGGGVLILSKVKVMTRMECLLAHSYCIKGHADTLTSCCCWVIWCDVKWPSISYVKQDIKVPPVWSLHRCTSLGAEMKTFPLYSRHMPPSMHSYYVSWLRKRAPTRTGSSHGVSHRAVPLNLSLAVVYSSQHFPIFCQSELTLKRPKAPPTPLVPPLRFPPGDSFLSNTGWGGTCVF